jgi:hypothetical protein
MTQRLTYSVIVAVALVVIAGAVAIRTFVSRDSNAGFFWDKVPDPPVAYPSRP